MRNLRLTLALALITAFAYPVGLLCQDAPTKAAPETVYKKGQGVKPPRAIYSPDPEYTTKARIEHQVGVVGIKMVVGADGLPRNIKVTRSLSLDLDQAAVDAVKRWRFAPGTKDGEPVAVEINVEISFRM